MCVYVVVGGCLGYFLVNIGVKWFLWEWIDCSDVFNKSMLLKFIDERVFSEYIN